MNVFGTIILVAVILGGFAFAVWAIRKTLNEETGRTRKERRANRRR